MDTEEQARHDFLIEAIEYCEQLESALLGMADIGIDLQKFDAAARAAHSIKGGAAMMGFQPLSRTAHSLEDYLKILQARSQKLEIDTELETLLLKGVDCLREIGEQYRRGKEPAADWLEAQTQGTFEPLHQRLGELTEADETALLSKEENADVADLLFGTGVEESLQRLKGLMAMLPPDELREELQTTTDELADFGRMIECEPFVSFCKSVKAHLEEIPLDQVNSLAESAIAQWERSQALIQLGRYDHLPTTLDTSEITSEEITFDDWEVPDLDDFEASELEELQTELEASDFLEIQESDFLDTVLTEELPTPIPARSTIELEAPPIPTQQEDTTVRVSVQQLARINTLFSRLILEREMLNSRVGQLEDFVRLSRSRTQQLEQANLHLRKWYDQLNLESVTVSNASSSETEDFDSLEMDRYSDLHLLFQEQMETIVQLQEVTTDIEVSSREVSQAMGDLNFTTSDLQRGITKVQTRPFAEAVKTFPRVVRDLSVQYDKPVKIVIQGENTLIDRAAFEALSAPLNHLLRNAFDHGIEDPETRLSRSKPKQGTITLQAINQGNRSVISISDDGGGIDREKIKARLRKMGTTAKELQTISDQELLSAIFTPGFSTAEQVTELSGRGVGMDVVRTNLEKIRGEINVQTEPGKGTTFTISFPLSLSIGRVVIVESAGVIFALPVEVVKSFARYENQDQGEIVWNGETIPVVSVEKWSRFNRPIKSLSMEGSPTLDRATVLIFEDQGTFRGLQVDRFWREQEVALRSVDSPIPLPPGVTGATVLGDGRPIPLVNPVQLVRWLEEVDVKTSEESNLVNSEIMTEDAIFDLIGYEEPIVEETILIIDDSIHVRRYLAMALEKAGYQVEQAKDGREAVEKILSGLPIKAAICDIEMPRLDGYGVLGEIKSHPDYKHLPIAMLTSRGNEKHRKLAMKLGASAYFSKPYNEQELLTTLASLITVYSDSK